MPPIPVSIAAPSSAIGSVELEMGLRKLRASGFDPRPHAHVLARHFVSAGTDEQRLAGMVDCAWDETTEVVWCGRGGYGAGRLLPLLDAATRDRGQPPRKLLVGYSDITPLHEFVRRRWGWHTLHGVMVSRSRVPESEAEWLETCSLILRERCPLAYEKPGSLRWIVNEPQAEHIDAELVGGNLSLWHTLAGTPWQPGCRGKFVFLEDLDEKLYAIDRYVVQIEQSGMFDGAAGIILGDFTACRDETNTNLDPAPFLPAGATPGSVADAHTFVRTYEGSLEVKWDTHPRIPQRRVWEVEEGLIEIFGRVAKRLEIPLLMGLPVGHGPNFHPLPLGASYRLMRDGALKLTKWDWLTA